MKIWFRLSQFVALLALGAGAMSPTATVAFVKITADERTLLTESANAPLTFTIPLADRKAIMDKAQLLVADGTAVYPGISALPLTLATDTVVQSSGDVTQGTAFVVTCSVNGSTADINVSASVWREKDVQAHMLAYLLQQYETSLTPQAQSDSAVPTDLDQYMQTLRSQIAAGEYASASATTDALKAALVKRQN